MEEDAIQVYIRHRTELLKAIYDNTPPEQEVGDYLISKMNLENHNITYEKIDVDAVCDSFSEYILSKAKEKKSEFGTMHNFRPAMAKLYGTDHNWRDTVFRYINEEGRDEPRKIKTIGRVKRAWNENDNKKYNYPLHSPQKDGEKYGSYRARNMIPHTMNHSMWPQFNPKRIAFGTDSIEPMAFTEDHYLDANPFDEKHHPVRKRRVDTGMPEWENMLREYYLSDNKWAEKGMEIEDAHKLDYTERDRNKDHGVYHGVNKNRKSRKLSGCYSARLLLGAC